MQYIFMASGLVGRKKMKQPLCFFSFSSFLSHLFSIAIIMTSLGWQRRVKALLWRRWRHLPLATHWIAFRSALSSNVSSSKLKIFLSSYHQPITKPYISLCSTCTGKDAHLRLKPYHWCLNMAFLTSDVLITNLYQTIAKVDKLIETCKVIS